MVSPHYMEPAKLLQYNQASGAFDALAGGNPQVRLGEGDLYVYIDAFDIRTTMAAGQTEYNSLPSVSVIAKQISTPTYLQRVRAEYDHHDTAAMSNWGVSIVEAQRLGMRQGHFQLMRSALLYGFNGSNGEGEPSSGLIDHREANQLLRIIRSIVESAAHNRTKRFRSSRRNVSVNAHTTPHRVRFIRSENAASERETHCRIIHRNALNKTVGLNAEATKIIGGLHRIKSDRT